jgi:hypothetical protein
MGWSVDWTAVQEVLSYDPILPTLLLLVFSLRFGSISRLEVKIQCREPQILVTGQGLRIVA